jgi:HPt (histidine-containing phosphotransfer) domain-containing protein
MKQMTPDAAAETAALIADLWQRNLPVLRERLDVLDRIAAASTAGPLSQEDREQGTAISHKFAGSLGMYGYRRGTEIATQLDELFRSSLSIEPERLLSLTYELRESVFPSQS